MNGPGRADLSRSGRLQSHESAPLRATGKAQVEDATYTDNEDEHIESVVVLHLSAVDPQSCPSSAAAPL